ncbi:sigma-70 family RNA polymerase sigma factor [Caldinitratiruptor microaerophilus]|uniref:RNA polymerase sigma-70 region 2 domain-containing protein n=1 Tax=Caldinitratiruptor microaerophilus TaxID=671077 RepID=A0AA35CPF0_9FIRM|nr:sigma-70 family RNA polymerase sigma factor [Caldinitratiruptor microaerophilus]BDG61300.1 hypothetical protein caldi_23900 [Caldinitratiruptor microaerophilus]
MTPEERFVANVPLAYAVAARFLSRALPMHHDDIRNEALVGLWKACRTYDSGRNVPFSAYAWPVITNEVRMFMRRLRRWHPPGVIISLEEEVPETDHLTYAGLIAYEPDLAAGVQYEDLVRLVREVGGPVVEARLVYGRSAVELAREAGCHGSHISRKYQEGLRRIRRALSA